MGYLLYQTLTWQKFYQLVFPILVAVISSPLIPYEGAPHVRRQWSEPKPRAGADDAVLLLQPRHTRVDELLEERHHAYCEEGCQGRIEDRVEDNEFTWKSNPELTHIHINIAPVFPKGLHTKRCHFTFRQNWANTKLLTQWFVTLRYNCSNLPQMDSLVTNKQRLHTSYFPATSFGLKVSRGSVRNSGV